MASALNLPEICTALLNDGVDCTSELNGATPLDLAIMTLYFLPGVGTEYDSFDRAWLHQKNSPLLASSERRNQTDNQLPHGKEYPNSRSPAFPSGQIYFFSCLLPKQPILRLQACC
ncbi:hypothetical protein AUP68_04612 [Ilyonectria robusta]